VNVGVKFCVRSNWRNALIVAIYTRIIPFPFAGSLLLARPNTFRAIVVIGRDQFTELRQNLFFICLVWFR
jgi:hypothetical protein